MTKAMRSYVLLIGLLACGSLLTGCPEQPITVTVIPDAATLEVGQTISLSVESTDAEDSSFTWTTSNAAIVALNATTGTAITVTAVGVGAATITATGGHSGVDGQAVVSVPVVPSEGEGEGEGEPVVIPGGKLAPGLNVKINAVIVPDDLKPEVTFTATDNKGNLIGLAELGDVRVILDYLKPGERGSTNRYFSYTTSIEDPDKVPGSGDEATQATYDSARLKGLSQHADGTMLYKFAKAIPADYNKSLTHQVGIQITRNYAVNGQSYPANGLLTFRPDGAAVSEVREISDTATCNECHTRMGLHGGGRREFQLCILCHNTQTADANSGNTVDMAVMIHKIHRGEGLPSVEAGHPYQIIGFNNSVNDYSTVAFPQDIRNCTVCHASGEKAAQSDFYMKKPTMAGCGSCHDRVWFGDPTKTPEGYENHPLDFEQTDDNDCAVCHKPTGGAAPIVDAHLTPVQRPEAPGLSVEITGVNANKDDGTLSVTFVAKYGNGTPITAVTTDPVLQRLGFLVAWPATDYQNSLSESIRSSRPMTGTLDTLTSDTGTYTYTFKGKLPIGTSDTFGIGVTGRVSFTTTEGPDAGTHEQGIESPDLTYFTVDGSKPVPRRDAVDDAKCNKCHGDLRAHGEQRVGVGLCVMCHRPNASAVEEDTAVTINLKDMLHLFHTGEELEHEFAIGSFVANEVRFPGDRRKCDICHIAGKETIPLPEGAAPTVVMNGQTLIAQVEPTRAACTTCHDGLLPNMHAILATGPAPDNVETCEVCHGTGADFAVSLVHNIGN